MIYEDYNYNKGEDLNHCPICQKAFKEGECVTEIELPKGPFLLVHKNCYNSVSKGKHENRTSSNVSPETLLKDEDKLWRYMDLAKFISILKNSTLYFSAPDGFSDIYEGAHGELKNKKAWDDFYFSFARASIITAPDNRWHKIEPEKLADNFQKQEAYIPGYTPGVETAAYIKKILNELSLPGSLFLTFVSIIPLLVANNISSSLQVGLSGSSLLIITGVFIEISRQIRGLKMKTNYGTFLNREYDFD